MFKRSARYLALVLTLVALTATARTAHAQSDDPCTDPSTGCVVTGGDPQPGPKVVTTDPTDLTNAGTDPTDDSQSLDDLISYLIILYGLA